jgi:predicted Zn-dependent protease
VAASRAAAQADPVVRALQTEVERSMDELKRKEAAPYFIGVEVTQTDQIEIRGEDGGLHGYAPTKERWVDVDLRLGSPQLDSTHPLREGEADRRTGGGPVPITDDPALIRHALWLEIDRAYHRAAKRWAAVVSESKVLVEEEPGEDLAPVPAVRQVGPLRQLDLNTRAWGATIKRASLLLARNPMLVDGGVTLSGRVDNRWFVSSEGTAIQHSEARYRLAISGETVAPDGAVLRMFETFDTHNPAELPEYDEIAARTQLALQRLERLREAPREDTLTVPAILSDRAAGVFFHEVFGHRVEGHRLKEVDNAQTFRQRVGERILPEFLSVYDDPTLERATGSALRGHYRFDNQGVPARRAVLVDKGRLTGFLESRSPVERGNTPNGHGRRERGNHAVSRQGNLVIEASRTVSDHKLREELISLAKAAGKPFGLYIDEIEGGFTFTDTELPNAFTIQVTIAHRVFTDGRPDELVRGVNLIGTPLEAFAKVVMAGEANEVFNGSCGAESGWVPVSAVSPSLLLKSVETQRQSTAQNTPPLLPPPTGSVSDGHQDTRENRDGAGGSADTRSAPRTGNGQ